MSPRVALPLSIGLLGGVFTILLASLGLPFWAGFVAWAAVLQAGGETPAVKNTMIGNAFGVVCAWLAALIWIALPLTGETSKVLWGGALIGAVLFGMCLVTNLKLFPGAPLSFYGYAVTWGFLVLTPGAKELSSLTGLHRNNALLAVLVSMWGGALFGLASEKLAGALTKR
jgi:hypothetical protein